MREVPTDAVREAPVVAAPTITGRGHWRGLVIATLAGLLMAFVGAFETDLLPLLPRLAYWLVIMESGALIGIGASTGIRVWGRLAASPLAEGVAITTLIALPLTLVATGTTALFFGTRGFATQGALVMFVAVFVITGAITAINYASKPDIPGDSSVAKARTDSIDTVCPVPEAPSPPRLVERLPAYLRGAPILALEAEDHYVRVHTAVGSELLLLRLTDATAELDGLAGARTHRSWWVARDAVRSAKRGDGRGELELANGVTAPVSRSALSLLRREGWFGEEAPLSDAS
ncbi:MAG: LytTR family transcriptional regulator DNA-binding domain-containing protein [Altererythrobacter sp.]|nr:LytTR family transcriptional regulator DNA-binding domain-containing protein [Altererythrobacter sp.]